jgi:hypothetical protein
MGQIILSDCSVVIGSITIPTNGIKSVTINDTPEMKDNTGMGMTAKSSKKGLDDWTIDIEIFQDYITGGLDEDLWALFDAGTTVGAIAIMPATVGGIGVSNPAYKSTAGMLKSYSPIAAGSVGELGVAKLQIVPMGAKLTRATT